MEIEELKKADTKLIPTSHLPKIEWCETYVVGDHSNKESQRTP